LKSFLLRISNLLGGFTFGIGVFGFVAGKLRPESFLTVDDDVVFLPIETSEKGVYFCPLLAYVLNLT